MRQPDQGAALMAKSASQIPGMCALARAYTRTRMYMHAHARWHVPSPVLTNQLSCCVLCSLRIRMHAPDHHALCIYAVSGLLLQHARALLDLVLLARMLYLAYSSRTCVGS